MLKILAIGALVATFAAPAAVDDPPAAPPPGSVVIDVVTVAGTGCPPGSTQIAVSPDNSSFDILLYSFLAEVGPGVPRGAQRRNCQFILDVHAPQGFTYALASAEYRGYASLAEGATATYRTSYYFQGQLPTTTRTRTFTGPYADDVRFTDVADAAEAVWAPCGAVRNFNVGTDVRLNAAGQAGGLATLDSVGAFTLQWQRC